MRHCDIKTSLFWFAMGVFIAVKGYKLSIGTLSNPGPGFIFFGSGVLLCILSTIVFLCTILSKADLPRKSVWAGVNKRYPIFILIGLFLYAYLFSLLGFLVTCFLFALFLFKIIGHRGWPASVLSSCLISFGAYFIFVVLLRCTFPKGILPF